MSTKASRMAFLPHFSLRSIKSLLSLALLTSSLGATFIFLSADFHAKMLPIDRGHVEVPRYIPVGNISNLEMALKKIAEYETILRRHDLLPDENQKILSSRTLDRNVELNSTRKEVVKHVTVIMYSHGESSECLKHRVETVVQEYPDIGIIVASDFKESSAFKHTNVVHIPNISGEGEALEIMISRVDSRYFLYLSPGVHIAPHADDQGVGWLYHALESIPELDFVGGSFLREEKVPRSRYPWFEVPCHRLRLCKWKFSQSMEYRYSVGDMMICEETSQSFMGRVESIKKVGTFDKKLKFMATTDFFLRGKGKTVVGLRPEVYFYVSKTCAAEILSEDQRADRSLDFMVKHEVTRYIDSFGVESKIKRPKNLKHRFDSTIEHWKHDTFALPDFVDGLEYNLRVGSDFFESKNISFFIEGGMSLGAIRMRSILPWDSGDIDTGFHDDWKKVKTELDKYMKEKKILGKLNTAPMSKGYKELMLFAGDRADGDNGVNTMFPQSKPASPDSFMSAYINGRLYPLPKHIFKSIRHYYGLTYLEMYGFYGGRAKCKKPGHHACLPAEFSEGGGHWRDYYCTI